MPLHVTCPECFQDYQLKDAYAGRKVRCKECGAGFVADEDADIVSEPVQPLPRKQPRIKKREKPRPKKPRKQTGQPLSEGTQKLIAAGVGVLVFLCVTGFTTYMAWRADEFGAPEEPYDLTRVSVPQFPEPQLNPASNAEYSRARVQLTGNGPGARMQLWLYLPAGEHEDHSLPCVLIAPAGTNRLIGMDLGSGDEPEHLPYVKAGFAVVAYSLDGPVANPENAEGDELADAYDDFKAARAGLVNARNALEFSLAKVPQVDPQRIFAAGHSSAGTLALLFVEHEPRLRGCVAYAPGISFADIEAELNNNRLLRMVFPDIRKFITRSSPETHIDRFACPLFLFHAEGDQVVKVTESRMFATQLESRGVEVTLETIPGGDHYYAMLNNGIPMAIEWMKSHE